MKVWCGEVAFSVAVFFMIKINNLRGALTDVSASTEALVATVLVRVHDSMFCCTSGCRLIKISDRRVNMFLYFLMWPDYYYSPGGCASAVGLYLSTHLPDQTNNNHVSHRFQMHPLCKFKTAGDGLVPYAFRLKLNTTLLGAWLYSLSIARSRIQAVQTI